MNELIVWWVIRIGILIIGIVWLISFLVKKRMSRDAAEEILETTTALYSTRHNFRTVSPTDFPDLDIAYYDRMQAWFTHHGFRHMGDIEDTTLSQKMPNARAFIRCMLSADGATTVGIYDVRFGGLFRLMQMVGLLSRNMKTIDIETEFSDGTFITTSNCLGDDPTTPPPEIHKRLHPRDTSPDELLWSHQEAVRQALEGKPGLSALAFSTLDEMLESQHRQQELKNAHQASIGYMDRQELMKIADGKSTVAAQAVADEIEQIKAERETDDEDASIP
jgi:hypothetical protein